MIVDILCVEHSWNIQCITLCYLLNSALLVSSIGNKSVRHNYKNSIWKVCEISIAIGLSILVMKRRLLSQPAISLSTVMSACVCVCGGGGGCVDAFGGGIRGWSTRGFWKVTACSGFIFSRCFF